MKAKRKDSLVWLRHKNKWSYISLYDWCFVVSNFKKLL
jgi:hypothetical protein